LHGLRNIAIELQNIRIIARNNNEINHKWIRMKKENNK